MFYIEIAVWIFAPGQANGAGRGYLQVWLAFVSEEIQAIVNDKFPAAPEHNIREITCSNMIQHSTLCPLDMDFRNRYCLDNLLRFSDEVTGRLDEGMPVEALSQL